MRRNREQIKWMSVIAVITFLISAILEFKILINVERLIIPYIPFIQGHRGYIVNVAVGICCSTVVVISGEYVEYTRTDKKIRYEIDYRLRLLKEKLEQIDTDMTLFKIREYREENLQEYKNLCKLEESYSPCNRKPRCKEYSEKLMILTIEVQLLFWSTLETYIGSDIKKERELYDLMENQPNDDMGKADWIYKCKLAKNGVEKTQKFHQKEFHNEIKRLEKKIEKKEKK